MERAAARQIAGDATATTRERILAAARQHFAEHGYAGTSVRTIARSLGISDPAVHYHFATKQALYEALLNQPNYGSLPLDSHPLTRASMVDQVLHLFSWWTVQPEFGRMLLREQLASEEKSVGFMDESMKSWTQFVTLPLTALIGERAEQVSAAIFNLLAGVFWDAILSYGDHVSETIQQPYFQERVRDMVDLSIPGERLRTR